MTRSPAFADDDGKPGAECPHCNVVRETRSVLFIESKLKVGGRIVATASGIWKILGEK